MLKRASILTALVLFIASTHSVSAGPDRTDKRELVEQAKASYYNLRRGGLDSFSATLSPNWDVVLSLGGKAADPVAYQNQMRVLNSLHIAMTFDNKGTTSVTHRADIPAANEKVQQGYNQIFSGMQQTIGGFMDTYAIFTVYSPFPDVDSDYTLENVDAGYRLTYKEGPATMTMTMTKTFVITEVAVNAADFESVTKPMFLTTADGYVLAGYSAKFKSKTGPSG